jgi:hypothetical protein
MPNTKERQFHLTVRGGADFARHRVERNIPVRVLLPTFDGSFEIWFGPLWPTSSSAWKWPRQRDIRNMPACLDQHCTTCSKSNNNNYKSMSTIYTKGGCRSACSLDDHLLGITCKAFGSQTNIFLGRQRTVHPETIVRNAERLDGY